MDIDALHSALLSLTVLTEQIRSARHDVSSSTNGGLHAFGKFLISVERDLLITKATLARELGFPVCQCCWPPELFVIDVNGSACCPGSRNAAAMKAFSREASPIAALLRVTSKPRTVDSFKPGRKNNLLPLRDGLVDSISSLAPRKLNSRANGTQAALARRARE